MFCCNSKDDGGSPVKKSKKGAAVVAAADISVAKKEAGLSIQPITIKSEEVKEANENSVAQPEANTKVNETAEDAPTEKANAAAVVSEDPTSKLEQLNKGAEENKAQIEGTLDEGEFESLVQVYKEKEKQEFKQAIMGTTQSNFTKHGSPKAKKNPLLKDFTLNQKGSPRAAKLPKLADINKRTLVDTKALGQFWKGSLNMYYDDERIFSIEQLKGFVRAGDLVRKEANDNDNKDEAAKPLPAVLPIGVSASFYQATEKLAAEITKMKEKYLKEKTGQ